MCMPVFKSSKLNWRSSRNLTSSQQLSLWAHMLITFICWRPLKVSSSSMAYTTLQLISWECFLKLSSNNASPHMLSLCLATQCLGRYWERSSIFAMGRPSHPMWSTRILPTMKSDNGYQDFWLSSCMRISSSYQLMKATSDLRLFQASSGSSMGSS